MYFALQLVKLMNSFWTLGLGERRNIVVETFEISSVSTNVSSFAFSWKHCCGSKSGFPGYRKCFSKNKKHLCASWPDFCFGNIVSMFAEPGNIVSQYFVSTLISTTRGYFSQNVSSFALTWMKVVSWPYRLF